MVTKNIGLLCKNHWEISQNMFFCFPIMYKFQITWGWIYDASFLGGGVWKPPHTFLDLILFLCICFISMVPYTSPPRERVKKDVVFSWVWLELDYRSLRYFKIFEAWPSGWCNTHYITQQHTHDKHGLLALSIHTHNCFKI